MTSATTPHPGFNRNVSGKHIKVFPGDAFWMGKYRHSGNGLSCSELIVPMKVFINEAGRIVTAKGKLVSKQYDTLYHTEAEANDVYNSGLKAHLAALTRKSKELLFTAEKVLSRSPSLRGSTQYHEFKHSFDDKV